MKRFFGHLEWQSVSIFFGFIMLAVTLRKTEEIWLAVFVGFIGLALLYCSARNAYVHKSTALIDKYDERFFDKMRAERKAAARFLLGEKPEDEKGPTGQDDLEDVLDFLEAPLAKKLEAGMIDAEQGL